MKLSKIFNITLLSSMMALTSNAFAYEVPLADGEVIDETGTDPRDFRTKFMPYWTTIDFEDGTNASNLTLFGMIRLGDGLAMTYEVPVLSEVDFSDTNGFPQYDPVSNQAVKDNYQGMGDANIRGFAMLGEKWGVRWMAGAEINLPTHSDDYLGTDRATIAPMLVDVVDLTFLPMPGAFMAQMHFYEFDIYKGDNPVLGCNDNGMTYFTKAECQSVGINNPSVVGYEEVDDVSRYKGRWFFMIPLHKDYKIYSLTEMQPIYDFETSHFSFWIAPEFGTAYFGPLLYVKPGWGINPKVEAHPDGTINDREFSLEFGLRIMEF